MFVGACAAFVVVLAPASSSGGSPSAPSPATTKAAVDIDLDRDRISEKLEGVLTGLGSAERADVLVQLSGPATADRVAELQRAAGTFPISRRFSLVDAFAASLTGAQIELLARLPGVARVEENSRVRALNNMAQASFGVAAARSQASALDGGDGLPASTKDDLVAAVIDTGIDANHLDLDEGKVLGFANCVSGTCSAVAPFDDNGHGTHVSATIAGDGDGRSDNLYKGVASESALVGVKVLDANGSGSDAGVIAGVQWAVTNKDLYGIEAINLSLGSSGCSNGTDTLSQAVNQAADAGIVVVVAAGNEGPGTCTVSSPGAAAKAITVGAMRDLEANGFALADFSSRGRTLDGRIKPEVVAPGVGVTSAVAGTANGYEAWDGTSMATPFVAGVALLMRDADPSLTPEAVRTKLTATAQDWGPAGPDPDYGWGRLDAYAALQSVPGAGLTGPSPAVPSHTLYTGSLSGTSAFKDYLLNVTDTQVPIAATMVMSGVTRAWSFSPDFDLYFYSPSGTLLARAESVYRQEYVGYKPTVAGTYRLRVRSYSGSGPYFVDVSTGTAPDTTPPSAPTGLGATAGNGQVALDWSDNSDADVAGYRVYRSEAGGAFSPIASPTASAYTDAGRTNGVQYSYYTTAVDSATPPNESAASATVSATPTAPPPAPPPPPTPSIKSYNAAGYTIAAGTLYSGTGDVTRLNSNNGVRVEVTAASGSPRVAELQPYTAITTAELATLSKLTINFDAGVSSSSASVSFRVCNGWSGSACASWETVASYGTGTTSDRSFTWTTTTPAAYVSPAGDIRVSIRGTRSSSSSFRTRTDWVRFTIEY